MRSVFEAELAEHIPVVKTSIQGTRLVGRMCVGDTPQTRVVQLGCEERQYHALTGDACHRQQEWVVIA